MRYATVFFCENVVLFYLLFEFSLVPLCRTLWTFPPNGHGCETGVVLWLIFELRPRELYNVSLAVPVDLAVGLAAQQDLGN